MLIRELLPRGQTLDQLSEVSDIPLDRLNALDSGTGNPSMREISALVEALDVEPTHLFRPAPTVLARRTGTDTGNTLGTLLNEIDAYLSAYEDAIRPVIDFAASTKKTRGARKTGEGWGNRHNARAFDQDADYPTPHPSCGLPRSSWLTRRSR